MTATPMTDDATPAAITETRVIEFTPIAIRAAAEGVGVSVLRLPPGLRVESVVLHHTINAVSIRYGSAAPERILGEGELAAMLIAYCISAKIPIPMKAQKRLRVTETCITFGFMSMRRLPHWVVRPMHQGTHEVKAPPGQRERDGGDVKQGSKTYAFELSS